MRGALEGAVEGIGEGRKGGDDELPEGEDAVGSGGTCQRLVGNGRVNSSGNLKRMGEHPASLIANQL